MIVYFVHKGKELVYIGQTVMTIPQRRGKHYSEARKGRGSVFGAGIRKHGEDAFEWTIVAEFKNQAECCRYEKEAIARHKPRYNMQSGGKKSGPQQSSSKTRFEYLAQGKSSLIDLESRRRETGDKKAERRHLMSEKSMVEAIIIGDGYISKRGTLAITHSINQRDYCLYKKKILENYGFKFRADRICPAHGYGKTECIKIESTASNLSKEFRKKFYPDGAKQPYSGMFQSWGWDEIAMLFQDDGRANKTSHYNSMRGGIKNRVEVEPFCNRYEFCKPLWPEWAMIEFIDLLASFKVEARIITHGPTSQKLISISKKDSKINFYSGVKDRVHKDHLYKLIRPCLSFQSERLNEKNCG